MAAVRENEIGHCRCPVCDSDKARLRVNAKQLAYVVCDSCNCQVFARSDRSDEKLRARHIPEPAAAPPAPAKPMTAATANAIGQQAATAAASTNNSNNERPAMGWGAFPWMK